MVRRARKNAAHLERPIEIVPGRLERCNVLECGADREF